ncbi:unnamed protein product [marine sediment metagenome]|uniref:Uncharacterized protein n=1 Tax=marine sediment metagenome TaxID=412755 RepID=X1KK02_9ZZZZ
MTTHEYYLNNKEKCNDYSKRYYLNNKERQLIYRKEWRELNKEYDTEFHRRYREKNKEKIAEQNKEYLQTKRGKMLHKISQKKYNKSERDRETNKKRCSRYCKSDLGKLASIRHKNKRKRNLGFIMIFDNPFADSEIIDWHHINDAYVVAIPRDLHRHYQGKHHREKVMDIVKQIYLGDR